MEIAVLIWVVCGLGAGLVALQRGGAGAIWFGIGFALGPIGLLLAFIASAPAKPPPAIAAPSRACPHCTARIPFAAARCMHCAKDVPPARVAVHYDGMGRPYRTYENDWPGAAAP